LGEDESYEFGRFFLGEDSRLYEVVRERRPSACKSEEGKCPIVSAN
jgi:hypothetical protein